MNTTDTRVELIWSLESTTALTAEEKATAAQRLRSRLNDGTITVVSSRYRSQHRNREAARVRLEDLVTRALVPPKPRRATRPTRASVERRLGAKKRRGELKNSRRRRWE